jgi:hypothetical protein
MARIRIEMEFGDVEMDVDALHPYDALKRFLPLNTEARGDGNPDCEEGWSLFVTVIFDDRIETWARIEELPKDAIGILIVHRKFYCEDGELVDKIRKDLYVNINGLLKIII